MYQPPIFKIVNDELVDITTDEYMTVGERKRIITIQGMATGALVMHMVYMQQWFFPGWDLINYSDPSI